MFGGRQPVWRASLRDGSDSCADPIVRAGRLRFVGMASIGARSVEDNSRWLVPWLGDTAEEEVADIGHDRSAARRDAILRDQNEQARQDVVNFAGGFKFFEFTDESGAEVRFLADEALAEVMSAEAVVEIGDGHAAAAAGRVRMPAASRVGEGFLANIGLNGLFVHFSSPMRVRWACHPGCFRKSGK